MMCREFLSTPADPQRLIKTLIHSLSHMFPALLVHQHVFELRAPRQLRQDVVGPHALHFARVGLGRRGPKVLSVVEHLRIRHVEGLVLISLDAEDILGIA